MHLSGKWEELFVAVTERSKNSGDKIPKKFKGETCSLREGVYGTFTAEQGKARWQPFQSCISMKKLLLSSVFWCLKWKLYAQRNTIMKVLLMSLHMGGCYRKKPKARANERVPWKLKLFYKNIWPTLWPSFISCSTTYLAYSMPDAFSICLSRNRGEKLIKVMLPWIRVSVLVVAKD